ncbi:MAG TPA: inorganic diphosphatase [Alphaproteobacteria bacterium]|nr:inorganic diphosphatase [Alphaproteobacteria bacterium]
MNARDYIGKMVNVEMDRPLGSVHPKHTHIIYGVNYGFIPNTTSGDGEELDAYVLGVNEPLQTFKGECVAVIHRTAENDDKLVVVPQGQSITDEQIRTQTHFQEQYFESEIWR